MELASRWIEYYLEHNRTVWDIFNQRLPINKHEHNFMPIQTHIYCPVDDKKTHYSSYRIECFYLCNFENNWVYFFEIVDRNSELGNDFGPAYILKCDGNIETNLFFRSKTTQGYCNYCSLIRIPDMTLDFKTFKEHNIKMYKKMTCKGFVSPDIMFVIKQTTDLEYRLLFFKSFYLCARNRCLTIAGRYTDGKSDYFLLGENGQVDDKTL